MTDRLAELQRGIPSTATAPDDIEAGIDTESDALLTKFNREADAIDKVFRWAENSLRSIDDSLADPAVHSDAASQIKSVEDKINAVRVRLKRIANENKDFARQASANPSSLRIRINRYTKLGKDFIDITAKLETLREKHKDAAAASLKADILRANPAASESQVDRAIAEGSDVQAFVDVENANLRYQIEDLRARNRDIQNLSKTIVELHQMFTDMSILVESQQQLINDIEANVDGVKADTNKAAVELEEARKFQQSARRKKVCICVIVIAIIVVIAAAIIIPVGVQNDWFGGGDDNNTEVVVAPPAPAPAPAPARPIAYNPHIITDGLAHASVHQLPLPLRVFK